MFIIAILIVNLMVSDIVTIIVYAFYNNGMTVSYMIDMQDPFRCDVFNFLAFPIIVVMYTFNCHALSGKVHSYQICPQV